jgi:hypothetical protein
LELGLGGSSSRRSAADRSVQSFGDAEIDNLRRGAAIDFSNEDVGGFQIAES